MGDVANWEELDASQSIIVGSPETVYRRIWKIVEQSKAGNLLIQFHIGNLPAELTRKSTALFARKVAPALRDDSLRFFEKHFAAAAKEREAGALP